MECLENGCTSGTTVGTREIVFMDWDEFHNLCYSLIKNPLNSLQNFDTSIRKKLLYQKFIFVPNSVGSSISEREIRKPEGKTDHNV